MFEYDKVKGEYWRFDELSYDKLYTRDGTVEGYGPDLLENEWAEFESIYDAMQNDFGNVGLWINTENLTVDLTVDKILQESHTKALI